MPIFLEGAARGLLVLHALVGLALLGAATHLAIAAIQLLRGKESARRMVRIHALTVPALFAAAMTVGLLMYPHYRVHVRGLFLDRSAPWASNLFDIKENFAALCLPLAVCAMASGQLAHRGQSMRWLLAVSAVALFMLLAFVVVSGLVVTSVKGV